VKQEEETIMGGTIVCGVPEAPDDRTAADLARALGARLGLRLVLVHIIDGVPAGTHESVTARQRQTGAEQVMNAIAREIGNGTERRVVVGDRAEALAQVAAEEGADLIVLGSRAAGLGSRKLRCTLARELEAATPVPVLVAPPTTRTRSEQRLSVAGGSRALEH
jgi:nucleotide-binding universal stress UspA family protein